MADGILILNDDCFLEMFRYLTLIDLANFKEAYKSCCPVAEMEFSRKTRGFLSFVFFDNKQEIDEAFQIIKQFGSSVCDLAIGCYSLRKAKWCEIFSVIDEHCTEKLKSLSLVGDAVQLIKKTDILLIADLFRNIEKIQLGIKSGYSRANEFFTILSHCDNIRSIKLRTEIDMPKSIFLRNKNVLKLKMIGWTKDRDLKTIANNLMNSRLEELSLKVDLSNFGVMSSNYLSGLARLNHLKRLFIQVSHLCPFLENVNALNSLNVLSISYTQIDETSIATLGRNKHLKVLQLMNCNLLTSSHLESLIVLCENKNFEHLRFLCYPIDFNAIDKVSFLKIVDRRKASAAENCLNITLPESASWKTVTPELLESNKETIKLIDIFDRSYEYWGL